MKKKNGKASSPPFAKKRQDITIKKRKEWISDKTWKKIEQRRIMKDKGNSAQKDRKKEGERSTATRRKK